MKSTDIKVGEKYLIKYRGGGRVLETRVERSSWRGGKPRKDGVKVFIEEGRHYKGQEMVVSSRDITKLWSEHAEEQEIRDREARVAQKERERTEELGKRLEKNLKAGGVELISCTVPYASRVPGREQSLILRVSEKDAERLNALLATDEVEERKAEISAAPEAPGNPLADLLS